ncbi:MAG: preprotein translocase subunit YajC [Coprobacillus sp.]
MNYWILICIGVACLPLIIQMIGNQLNKKEMQKQIMHRKEYLDSLKTGDEILMLSGIHGKIISIKDELIELMISENINIYIEKDSIMGKTKELLFK